MNKANFIEKSSVFLPLKEISFFNIYWDFPSSFQNFLPQKDYLNFFWSIRFCRARPALSNHVKYICDIIDSLDCRGGCKDFVTPCIYMSEERAHGTVGFWKEKYS
jgi:hypothetical protein